MSETPGYSWGHEHFCPPDTRYLYDTEPHRLNTIGFPKKLEDNPEPPTFCSMCLRWFDDPEHTTAANHLPPEQGETHA